MKRKNILTITVKSATFPTMTTHHATPQAPEFAEKVWAMLPDAAPFRTVFSGMLDRREEAMQRVTKAEQAYQQARQAFMELLENETAQINARMQADWTKEEIAEALRKARAL